MTFLNPVGLLLLLTLPAIVVLHLFRQERRRQEVSSLFLWNRLSDQQSRRVRPRLLRNINLILQLLAATAAALAISQPVFPAASQIRAPRLVIALDTSASMKADEGSVTRIELAKNRAREIVGRSRRDTEIMVATFSSQASVIQGFTTDRGTLYESIREITAIDSSNDYRALLELLHGIGADAGIQMILVTDGGFGSGQQEVPEFLQIETVGSPRDNRGITKFELRTRLDNSAVEAYVVVANHSDLETEVLLEISVDEETILRRNLQLGPNEERQIALDLERRVGGTFRARLIENQDALAADDVAFAVATGTRPVRVYLVSPGDFFLESLLSVYPNIDVRVSETFDQSIQYDVLILDGVEAPPRLGGSIVAFGSVMPDGPFLATGETGGGANISVAPSHQITENIRLDDVKFQAIATGQFVARTSVLASAGGNPLLYTYTAPGLSLVGTTFTLADTDLPVRGTFPILVSNIINYLAPAPQSGDIGYVRAGQPVSLYVAPGEPLAVTAPDGTVTQALPRSNPYEFTGTSQVGVYGVRGLTFVDQFAVSLADSHESLLTSRVSSSDLGLDPASTRELASGRPLWPYLALLGVLFLATDFVIWARRT